MVSLSMQLTDDLADQLGVLAKETGIPQSLLVVEAIKSFIEQELWQVTEIKNSLIEADELDFATDEEIQALDIKWGYHAD